MMQLWSHSLNRARLSLGDNQTRYALEEVWHEFGGRLERLNEEHDTTEEFTLGWLASLKSGWRVGSNAEEG